MKKITEKQVENALVKLVNESGGIAYKFSSPNRRLVPDRLVLLPYGHIFFVECKSTGKKATKAQLREHEKLRKLGFKVFVIDFILTDADNAANWWRMQL